MRSSADCTGFPLIEVPEAGVEVQLLPATKVQLEQFLAGRNAPGDTWYETLLSVHPRVSWRRFGAEDREQLLVGGILPDEALRFAAWMGRGFDLPTVEEWRAVCRTLPREILTSAKVLTLQSHSTSIAHTILDRILDQLRPATLLDLSLMRGGLVEWVRDGGTWSGLGCPRPAFWPNVWDPLADAVRPINLAGRLPYFGFRLVRRR
jgi:hypothetical protein